MPVRTATATWEGALQSGKGTMAAGSGTFSFPFSVGTRFGEEAGTNPEELIAAAYAGCFSMALSAQLGRAGYEPERIQTTARVRIQQVEGRFVIDRIELETEAKVPGIDEAKFREIAEQTKLGCPVGNALSNVPEISLTARLVG
ncbi:MAG: OsmC family protein [Thermomicrobium sp.]|nr:OsmC family protein [Thermomicrobium sp.]MDW8060886.1 OsmC family protein [Thermomicrobium sp.]